MNSFMEGLTQRLEKMVDSIRKDRGTDEVEAELEEFEENVSAGTF